MSTPAESRTSRSFLVVHWVCKLGCGGYFVVLAYGQIGRLSDELLVSDVVLLVASVCLAVLMSARPPAAMTDTRPVVLLLVVFSKFHYILLDFTAQSGPTALQVGTVLTSLGLLMWSASVLSLGRSFSILPALRRVRTSGMYRFVRHPVYLSYLVLDTGLVFSFPSVWNAVVLLAALGTYVFRARIEESVLTLDQGYRVYMARTPHRLVPFLY